MISFVFFILETNQTEFIQL